MFHSQRFIIQAFGVAIICLVFPQVQAQTESDFINSALEFMEDSITQPLNSLFESSQDLDFILTESGLNPVDVYTYEHESNCFNHEYSLPGQGDAHTIGSGVDGLTNYDEFEIPFSAIFDDGLFFPILEGGGMSENIGILILDDFNQGHLINPEFFDAIVDSSLSQNLSHGALVLNHINSLILASGSFDSPPISSTVSISISGDVLTFETQIWTHALTGVEFTLMAVNTGQNTSEAKNALEAGLTAFNQQLNINRVTVNMSFALLPCETVEAFVANKQRFEEFEAYLVTLAFAIFSQRQDPSLLFSLQNLLAEEPVITLDLLLDFLRDSLGISFNSFELFRRAAVNSLLTPFNFEVPNDNNGEVCSGDEVDDLLSLICSSFDSPPELVAYVASSGNYKLEFQTHPALLREVVGVSASDPNGFADFSNPGEIMAPGAFFRLMDPANINGFGMSVNDFGDEGRYTVLYSGTSFAAPIVSLYTALEMAQAVPECTSSTLDHRPGLVYTLSGSPRHPDPHPQLLDYPALMNESINDARAATPPACPYP